MSGKAIVITRQADAGDDLVAAVAALGYQPLVEPVLTIEFLEPAVPDISPEQILVFTSANAVKAFAGLCALRSNPVYTVGRTTAEEARRSGFTRIETAAGTVDDLVEILLTACKETGAEPLYVRGEEISKDLKAVLEARGVSCGELTAYRSVPAEALSVPFLKALDARVVEAVLFFSPKGGRVFADLVEQYGREARMRTTKALCISEAVLQSVSVLPFGGSLVAAVPDRHGMITLLEQLKD